MNGHYESSVWRNVTPPMRVRIDWEKVLPFLYGADRASMIVRSTGLRVESTTVGELHAWIRTSRGLWVAKCSVTATIGQSHTVQMEVYAPEGTIQPAPDATAPAATARQTPSSPRGESGTQRAVSSGASGYFYDYDADGNGTLRCCPDGQVAYTDPGGRVHCAHKGEASRNRS